MKYKIGIDNEYNEISKYVLNKIKEIHKEYKEVNIETIMSYDYNIKIKDLCKDVNKKFPEFKMRLGKMPGSWFIDDYRNEY